MPFSQFVLVQPVAIPADATEITLSFWFSRLGTAISQQGQPMFSGRWRWRRGGEVDAAVGVTRA